MKHTRELVENRLTAVAILFIGLLFVTELVQAQPFNRLELDPEMPIADEPFLGIVNFRLSIPPVAQPAVNSQGLRYQATLINQTLIFDAVIDFVFFFNTPSATYVLPELEEGEYTLILNAVSSDITFPAQDKDRLELTRLNFTVLPSPSPVPTNSPLALILLVIGLLMTGVLVLLRSKILRPN